MTERTGPVGLRPDVEEVWGELRADFALQQGFWLAFLFGGEPLEIVELIARTRDLALGEVRQVEQFTLAGGETVKDLIVQLLTPHGPLVAVTWVTDRGGVDADRELSWRRLLRHLSERRDVLRAARPAGLIMACPAGLMPMVRDQAPDLWSFRSVAAALDPPHRGPEPEAPSGPASAADHSNPFSPIAGRSITATPGVAARLRDRYGSPYWTPEFSAHFDRAIERLRPDRPDDPGTP